MLLLTLIDVCKRAAFTDSRRLILFSTDSGTAGSFLAAVVSFFLNMLKIKY